MAKEITVLQTYNLLIQQGIEHIHKLSSGQNITQKLGVQVTYQLACVGIEYVLTGLLFAFDEVIEHGNILLMLKKLQKHISIDESWIDEARFINRFGEFCSLDIIQQRVPTPADIERMVKFASSMATFGKSFTLTH
jgi:hypothetical protein